MKKIEERNGTVNLGTMGYICSVDEFTVETTAPDGSELQVVDESTHTVVSYHIAYKGYWNKR